MRLLLNAFAGLTLSAASLASAQEPALPHWDYTGPADAEHWGTLDPSYHACVDGSVQSPIDIRMTEVVEGDLPSLETKYQSAVSKIVNNGHTVQVAVPPGSGFDVEHHHFEMLQFHFHAPSEFRIDGRVYPMEVHFVHQREDAALGVIGVLVQEGAENPELQKVLDHMPATIGEVVDLASVQIDITKLLPQDQRYYRLMGSLTTPPCSEGVHWFVMEQPMTASKAQIEAFSALFPEGDARPLQKANYRLVVRDTH